MPEGTAERLDLRVGAFSFEDTVKTKTTAIKRVNLKLKPKVHAKLRKLARASKVVTLQNYIARLLEQHVDAYDVIDSRFRS